MTEELLFHIWKFRLFNHSQLQTTDGEIIEVLHPGSYNSDAGPDFFNARIRIAGTLWAGNVEVHINSQDWNKHHHQKNKLYDTVILHVVYNQNSIITRSSGEAIPVLELKKYIEAYIQKNYLYLKTNKSWIACEKQFYEAPKIIVTTLLDRMLVERLEEKSARILQQLSINKMNWEETFYQLLARSFGFSTNALPFELLAKSLPVVILGKHKNSLLQIEALLFGQAGLLDQHLDNPYLLRIQNEYTFLKNKFRLVSIDAHLWKFLRLRPSNFPTVRIAQFASLVHHSQHLFSKFMETQELQELIELMRIDVSDYWKQHYHLTDESMYHGNKLGIASIQSILINTLIPFLFVYGKAKGEEGYQERAFVFLEQLPGEQNSITKKWKQAGAPVNNALATQALLQLKINYCDHKKCLMCPVGNFLLKKIVN